MKTSHIHTYPIDWSIRKSTTSFSRKVLRQFVAAFNLYRQHDGCQIFASTFCLSLLSTLSISRCGNAGHDEIANLTWLLVGLLNDVQCTSTPTIPHSHRSPLSWKEINCNGIDANRLPKIKFFIIARGCTSVTNESMVANEIRSNVLIDMNAILFWVFVRMIYSFIANDAILFWKYLARDNCHWIWTFNSITKRKPIFYKFHFKKRKRKK